MILGPNLNRFRPKINWGDPFDFEAKASPTLVHVVVIFFEGTLLELA